MLRKRFLAGVKKGLENFLLVLALDLLILTITSPLNSQLVFGLDVWLIFSFLVGFLYGFTYNTRWKALPSLIFWSFIIYGLMSWEPVVSGVYLKVYVSVNLSPIKWIALTWATLSLLVDLLLDLVTK